MKSIEIVTHAYSGAIPIYWRHMLYQASSLLWYPPKADVTLTVFWAGERYDPAMANLVEHIDKRRAQVNGRIVFNFVPIVLPREKLFRRAIGRHMVSQQSVADVIWYCDADMAFGEGCIDYVQGHIEDDGRLYGPGKILISTDWQTGDAQAHAGGDWPRIHGEHGFKWQRNKVLIGGSQILGRETAKRLGYLGDQPKWQKPVNPDKPFACFRDDSSWRRQHFPLEKQMQVKLAVPNVYRLRHSKSSIDPEGKRLTSAPTAAQ